MSTSRVKFDSFDEPTRSQAMAALKVLDANDGHDLKLPVGSDLARILRRFVQVALDAGGGMQASTGWLVAFLVMAAGGLAGPIAIWWSLRDHGPTG